MKIDKTGLRLILWTFVLGATVISVDIAYRGWLFDPFKELVIAIEAVVIAEMSLYEIMKRLERADIRITADAIMSGKAWGFGIQVRSMNKTLKDAWVICNSVRYPWIEKDGKPIKKRDIYVGEEPPARFVPFKIRLEKLTEENIDKQPDDTIGIWLFDPKDEPSHGESFGKEEARARLKDKDAVLFVLSEVATGKDFLRLEIVMPRGLKGHLDLGSGTLKKVGESHVSIRLIAEGVEQMRDYRFRLSPRFLEAFTLPEGTRGGGLGLLLEEV